MKDVYKDVLFNHNILVCEAKTTLAVSFATRYLLEKSFGIRITAEKNLVTEAMVPYVAARLGKNVPEPFYRGFPESVRKLSADELLFDQWLHYYRTYGEGDFSAPGQSVVEERVEREAFCEDYDVKEFCVITEEKACEKLLEYAESLLTGSRPLSEEQYRFVHEYIADFSYELKRCPSKSLAIRLLLDFRNVTYADFLCLSDVIKLVDELNYQNYGGRNVKKLNLRNQDRKFVTDVINYLFRAGKDDVRNCFEKKAVWNGLLHQIHYKPLDEASAQFVQLIRGKSNYSVYAEFEAAMAEKDICAAVNALVNGKGKGAVLRNLNYIVSRCESEEEFVFVVSQLAEASGLLLMQLLMSYGSEQTMGRTFKFSKYNMLSVHRETVDEQSRRKSVITEKHTEMLRTAIESFLQKKYKGTLGKVYIDSNLEKIALPLQENTSSSGYGVLPKGSRFSIESRKKIRVFTYWEAVNDIDLSVIGVSSDGSQTELSWRTFARAQSDAFTHSGDVTSGFYGGSEYIDFDIEKMNVMFPNVDYWVFCNNIYTRGVAFRDCICRAGYMLRDVQDSGEIFEPKTVKTSYNIDCDSTAAYLFAIDISRKELVFLNIARNSNASVAGDTDIRILTDYLYVTDRMNMKKFFTMLASEVVDDMSEADVIVTDANVSVRDGVEVIRSFDFERMIELLNA